jgi:arylsulfatase A-like enzyme
MTVAGGNDSRVSSMKSPNIILFVTDDQAAHAISCYGSRINQTPNIDRLAAGGMRLEQCFCTNAVCTPARATLLTGQYGHLNGVRSNGDRLDGRNPDLLQFKLKEQGYQNGLFGKWHLGHGGTADPTGFDTWKILHEHGNYEDPLLLTPGGEESHKGYLTDVITDQALDWVSTCKRDQPFFLMVAHKAPHRPFVPAARHADRYLGESIPEPSTLFDDYANRAAPAAETRMRIGHDLKYSDLRESPPEGLSESERTKWNYQAFIKHYIRCCDALDENVGRMLDYLDAHDLTEDTVFMFTSDHGFFLGDHGWFDKRFMYEPSMRIPCIVRYPREIGVGLTSKALVSNLDFAPTLLDYAGVTAPVAMQGKSVRGVLDGSLPGQGSDSIYYRYWIHHDQSHHVCAHYGIRTSRYKLIYYYGKGLGCRGTGADTDQRLWELFDLEEDPDELKNLHDAPEYAPVFNELRNELTRLQRHYGDQPEHELPEMTS